MLMTESNLQVGPLKLWVEGLMMNRPLSWFHACPWGDGDGFRWIRWLLHRTKVGRWFVSRAFAYLADKMFGQSGVMVDEKTKGLVPEQSLRWYGAETGTLSYDNDLYELISSDRVQVVRGELDHLDEDSVFLQDGQVI